MHNSEQLITTTADTVTKIHSLLCSRHKAAQVDCISQPSLYLGVRYVTIFIKGTWAEIMSATSKLGPSYIAEMPPHFCFSTDWTQAWLQPSKRDQCPRAWHGNKAEWAWVPEWPHGAELLAFLDWCEGNQTFLVPYCTAVAVVFVTPGLPLSPQIQLLSFSCSSPTRTISCLQYYLPWV